MRQLRSPIVFLLALAAVPAPADPSRHFYGVTFDANLQFVEVTAQLAGDEASVEARNGDARRLRDLATCDGDPLVGRGSRVVLDGVRCFGYRYPLEAPSSRREIALRNDVSISSPSNWLWLPKLAGEEHVRVAVSLPEGYRLSVPWVKTGEDTYRVSASPQSARSYAVAGRFRLPTLTVGADALDVALVDTLDVTLDEAKTLAWLEASLGGVSGVYGRLPNPDLQIIVVPSGRGRGSPVPFGHVMRDGGETVQFFVDPQQSLERYLGDWTADHEFAHILLPYVRGRQKWISEGFASYYQNVLLARRGAYTEQQAWQRLHRSFSRARETPRAPSPNGTSERPFWEVRMMIYWSGAAIALMADERLRRLSDNEVSLDTVLGDLQACCLPSPDVWRGRALFEKLDALSPVPVFVGLYDEYADTAGMPDLSGLYADLGIRVADGRVSLDDGAPFANVRRAIMKTD